MKAYLLAAVTLIVGLAVGKRGADFGPDWQNNFSVSDLQCLKSTGIEFLIIRGWQKYGAMDIHAVDSLKRANQVGFETIDTYLFPCRSMSAQDQVAQLVGNLTQAGSKYGKIWLDIEENPWEGCGWDKFSFESNCQYIADLLAELRRQGQTPGIYASHYEWVTLLGNDTYCSNYTDVPLWYAHFDGVKSFDDYPKYQFGGWKQPLMKQYIDLTRNTVCGFTIDQDFMPDGNSTSPILNE